MLIDKVGGDRDMSYVRLRGLAQKSKGTNIGILSENTGYSFVLDGNDLISPEDDEQLKKGPPPVLKTENKPIFLSRENHKQIAEIYIEKYNLNDLRSYGARKYYIECINGINKLMGHLNPYPNDVGVDARL